MSQEVSPQSHAQASDIHVCPMHPEVRQSGPGRCPKCGMYLVPEAEAARTGQAHACHRHDHHGHEPTPKHARVHDTAARPASGKNYDHVPPDWTGAVYTCPMHPEVRQTEAGSCPICGMGLELESAAMVDDGPNPELVDFTRRFWIGAALTVPLWALWTDASPERRALLIQVFAPLMTNSSPSVFATVVIACRSEPPPGSVSAMVARSSPVAIRGR